MNESRPCSLLLSGAGSESSVRFRCLSARCVQDAVGSLRPPSMLPLSNILSGLLERVVYPLRFCAFFDVVYRL